MLTIRLDRENKSYQMVKSLLKNQTKISITFNMTNSVAECLKNCPIFALHFYKDKRVESWSKSHFQTEQ
jgi:hypothetical protein